MSEIKSKVMRASKWAILGELAYKVISPLIVLVLANILLPEDFGVFAAATMVVSFSQIFWDAGLSKALIQSSQSVDRTAPITFWLNLGLALVLYTLLFLSADSLAMLFHDSRVGRVLRIQGIQIVLLALCSVQAAIFQKELEFRTLFWMKFLTAAVPGFASIPLAFLGYGYWSIVIGSLCGAITQLVFLWKCCRWKPSLYFNADVAIELLKFGGWVSVSGLLTWFYLWADALIVGMYLDVNQLGLYRTGNTLVLMAFGLVLSPVLPVLFSTLSQLKDDRAKFEETVLKTAKIIAFLCIPMGIGLFFLSSSLSAIVFPTGWEGIEHVIAVLALMHGVSWLVGANSVAYRAIGRPNIETIIMMVGLVVYVPTYLIAVRYGLNTFLFARLVLASLMMFLHFYVGQVVLSLKPLTFLIEIRGTLCAAVALCMALYITNNNIVVEWSAVTQLLFHLILGLMVYISVVWLIERAFLKQLLEYNKAGWRS